MEITVASISLFRTVQQFLKSPAWLVSKELLATISLVVGLVVATFAVLTYMGTASTRRQEVDSRKFTRTVNVLEDYNEKRVVLIAHFFREFDERLSDRTFLANCEQQSARMQAEQLNAAKSAGLIDLLHYLNILGYYLVNDRYIFKDDLVQSFKSELHDYLNNEKYQYPISVMLAVSSMKYVENVFIAVDVTTKF